LVGFLYSRKDVDLIFSPMLADMRDEYFAALADGRVRKARWTLFVYYWSFVRAILLHRVTALGKQLFDLWKILR